MNPRTGSGPLRPIVAFLSLLLCLASVAVAAGPPRRPSATPPATDIQATPSAEIAIAGFEGVATTDDGRIQVMVELEDPPAAVVYADAMAGASPADKAATRSAGAQARAQVARIEAAQESIAAALTTKAIGAREIYRVQKALNGIAVAIQADRLAAVRSLPGVKRVLPIQAEYPTNSTSVPFIGAPNVWANTVGLPAGADGTGIRIGIIDTGLDYLHPDFGGPGAEVADYQAEQTDTANFTTVGTAAGGPFPTAKVVGGTDFAGSAYTGTNVPAPDANPMDCNGHGSHVAGSAAGFGMTAAGATFAGPYDANPATYSGLLIGPGVAPMASLYGLRVFGCAGSTTLTALAIDWAMDPNNDSDLSDHLDVINMSLGSRFGSAVTATAVASDNAALAGVIVVASAGNDGDTFFITGAPGVGSRVVSTAASLDSGITAAYVRINSPSSLGTGYLAGTAAFGPPLTPTGTTGNVVLALDPSDAAGPLTTDGCTTPFDNAAAVAGNIALIDRGTCGFAVKTANAQANGAIGVIIANNAPGSVPPGMLGVDPTITIPAVSIALAEGNTLKAGLLSGPVNVTLLGAAGSDTLAYFSSRGPRRIYGSPLRLKPDIAAPGWFITSVQTGITCLAQSGCTGLADPSGIQVGTRNLVISGTSMASPHMAGVMALLRQLKPDWSVEELKALAMNYALHDTTLLPGGTPPAFGPSRIGGGRVDPSLAAVANVVAMNADDPGLVSVTFDPEATVPGPVTQTKTVRVENKGTTSQTYNLGFQTVVDSPGVAFSLPGGPSLTVGPGQTEEVLVQMTATPSAMDHTRDPSLFPLQGVQPTYGDQPRSFLTEEGAYLTFSQSSTVRMRLPVYMAEWPASDMHGADTIVTGGAATGTTTIALSGADLCTGTLAAGPTCTGTFPTDVESLVSHFELQVVSPLDPVNSTDYADIHYVGTAYWPNADGLGAGPTHDLLLFGVASWGDWSTPNEVTYNICVDYNNDGVYEKIIWNGNPSVFVGGASPLDTFVRIVRTTSGTGNTILGLGSPVNLFAPNQFEIPLHLNNVMVLGVTPFDLGVPAGTTEIRYRVFTCPGNSTCARTASGSRCSPSPGTYYDVAAGPYFYDWANQGLNFGGVAYKDDLAGASIPVTWNTANMTANGSLGALLLHHHNGAGNRAEVVLLDTAQSADLAVTKTVDNAAPAVGSNVTFTVTVTNNGPNDATGVVVYDWAADGFGYVSDDGGGAFNPATGLWAVPGSLAVGASATLHITVSVDLSGAICNNAQITAGTPLDPDPSDNQATQCVNAPRSADLAVTIAAAPAAVNVGAPIVVDITVTNNGDDPAYDLDTNEVFDPALVPAASYSGVTVSQGAFAPATGLWDLASLQPGASATLSFVVAAPPMAGTLTNTVSTLSNKSRRDKAADPIPGNNTASASVTVSSPAAIGIRTKTVSGSYAPGGAITYVITLGNPATTPQLDNPGDEFVDILPAQLVLTGAAASSGTALAILATNTVTWNGLIPAGGSVAITINATVGYGTYGQTLSNQGTIHFDADGNGTNESSLLTDDPAVGGADDPTEFTVAGLLEIPTLSPLGLAVLLAVLAGAALLLLRRRRAA